MTARSSTTSHRNHAALRVNEPKHCLNVLKLTHDAQGASQRALSQFFFQHHPGKFAMNERIFMDKH